MTFSTWCFRDEMLMDQWRAAVEHENSEEAGRMLRLLQENWDKYREQKDCTARE